MIAASDIIRDAVLYCLNSGGLYGRGIGAAGHNCRMLMKR
jgi:hypothetical protein